MSTTAGVSNRNAQTCVRKIRTKPETVVKIVYPTVSLRDTRAGIFCTKYALSPDATRATATTADNVAGRRILGMALPCTRKRIFSPRYDFWNGIIDEVPGDGGKRSERALPFVVVTRGGLSAFGLALILDFTHF